MGRITVFALEDCPHCKRAKAALTERAIPYVEISLSTHPQRRTDMISLSDRLSVPQIFFNDKHIGGADDTLQLLESENWNQHKYQTEIESQSDPTDERLRISTEPPLQPREPLPRDETDLVPMPDGSTTKSVLELMEQLKTILKGKKKTSKFCKFHKHSFTGGEAVAALGQEFSIKEDAAIEFGKLLLQREIIMPVLMQQSASAGPPHFSNSKSDLFRLSCYHTPNVLNSYRVWNTRVDTEDPMGVLTRCKKLLGKVESAVTNSEGLVDYRKAPTTEGWPIFEEAVCELQGIDMTQLDYPTLLAFSINLYNLMIKYSFMKVGIHNDPPGLMAYFSKILFNVGGLLFGFHDLESGVLRGNRHAPYAFRVPIGNDAKKDPRLALVLSDDRVDCRIHFGLNCGAKSCPPVKNFTPEGIDEELRIVAQAFAEDDDNITVDAKRRTLGLSQIINWYKIDFAPNRNNAELPAKIVAFLRDGTAKKQQLQSMIDDGKPIKIKFKPYDWTTNASDFVTFRRSHITADYTGLF